MIECDKVEWGDKVDWVIKCDKVEWGEKYHYASDIPFEWPHV